MFLSFLYLRHNRTTENSFKKGDVIVRITSPFFFSSEKHDAILNQNYNRSEIVSKIVDFPTFISHFCLITYFK